MKIELWLIWKQPISRRRYTIGTLTKHNNNYTFRYTDNIEEIKKLGFDFFPGFQELDKVYNSTELFDTILSRLPNKNRNDYIEILKSYGLDENSTEMEILEKTKGRLLTDNFEFVPIFNEKRIEFEIAGTRYSKDLKKCKELLKVGERLLLELENNEYDENAIAIKFQNYKIGYIPRYYSEQLASLIKKGIEYKAYIINLKIQSKIEDEIISAKVELNLQ